MAKDANTTNNCRCVWVCKPKDKKIGSDDEEKATARLFEIQCKDAKRANIKPICTKRKEKAKVKYANLSRKYIDKQIR